MFDIKSPLPKMPLGGARRPRTDQLKSFLLSIPNSMITLSYSSPTHISSIASTCSFFTRDIAFHVQQMSPKLLSAIFSRFSLPTPYSLRVLGNPSSLIIASRRSPKSPFSLDKLYFWRTDATIGSSQRSATSSACCAPLTGALNFCTAGRSTQVVSVG